MMENANPQETTTSTDLNSNQIYPLVNIKNYPIDPSIKSNKDEPPPKRNIPQAYLGQGGYLYVAIPLRIQCLAVVALECLYLYMIYQYWEIINEYDTLIIAVLSCFLLTLIDFHTALFGLQVFKRNIVSPQKLVSLQCAFLFGIFLHIVIPVYTFLPDYRGDYLYFDRRFKNSSRKPDYSTEYWRCVGFSDVETKNYTQQKNDPTYCSQHIGIGYMFWTTLPLFLVLLLSWKMSMVNKPVPIHPDAINVEEFDKIRSAQKRGKLSTMYMKWEETNKFQKNPYAVHYPTTNNSLMDENLNLKKTSNLSPGIVEDNVIPKGFSGSLPTSHHLQMKK